MKPERLGWFSLKEICGNCGFTFGSHKAEGDFCPEHEGRRDWNKLTSTRFEQTGTFKEGGEMNEVKFCRGCEHGGSDNDMRCSAPEAEPFRDIVKGWAPTCYDMRYNEECCGKDARWFKPPK